MCYEEKKNIVWVVLKCSVSLAPDSSGRVFFVGGVSVSTQLLTSSQAPCRVACKFVCDISGQVCFCGHLKLGTADSNADARLGFQDLAIRCHSTVC